MRSIGLINERELTQISLLSGLNTLSVLTLTALVGLVAIRRLRAGDLLWSGFPLAFNISQIGRLIGRTRLSEILRGSCCIMWNSSRLDTDGNA